MQPIRVSEAAEMHPRPVQDLYVSDADVNLLCCLQVATALDVAVKHTHFILQPKRIIDAAEK